MNSFYYVWVGNTMRSVLFDNLKDAEQRRQKLLSEGYKGVWVETIGETK